MAIVACLETVAAAVSRAELDAHGVVRADEDVVLHKHAEQNVRQVYYGGHCQHNAGQSKAGKGKASLAGLSDMGKVRRETWLCRALEDEAHT